MRIACLENPNETLYCVGYDYFHNQTSSGVYLGSSTNITNSESQNWIKQHSKIEEEKKLKSLGPDVLKAGWGPDSFYKPLNIINYKI